MKKLITFLLLISISKIYSQSIGSYLSNFYKYDKNSNFIEIKEETKFYNKNGVKREIEYKTFNKYMDLISLKRFNSENKLIWLNIYKYDSLRRRIRLDNKHWINVIGYQKKHTTYEYDSIGNCLEIQFNSNNKILNITKYEFDTNRNLVQLANYNGSGNLIGYEKAKYYVDENTVEISQFNNKGKLIITQSHSIDYSKDFKHKTQYEYNEYGDLIFWERRLNENDNVCYTIEYKYDKRKNWISKKKFSQIKTKNGKLKKKKIKMIKTREIKYGI
ncbi:conserved hypothetical protein [Tenacibaculum litopenaei]|uniref:hypothetical protein n=1 Tax=Tenacibaculum litopenaei TaxID=396016 RepID=UPI003895E7B7